MLQAIFLSTGRRISTLLQVAFFFTDQCISSHSLSSYHQAHILSHSECARYMLIHVVTYCSPRKTDFSVSK